MSLKKKLGMGIAAGALGLSLVGGGSWAAFNDVETTTNTFTAGTLDLGTNTEKLFDISNLKPGDYFTKTLELSNNGQLPIDEILLSTTVSGWSDVTDSDLPDNGVNSEDDFLSQFLVTITKDGNNVFSGTAKDLKGLTNTDISGTADGVAALSPGDTTTFVVNVEFENKTDVYTGTRIQQQNKYQGEGANMALKLEATQMPGEERTND